MSANEADGGAQDLQRQLDELTAELRAAVAAAGRSRKWTLAALVVLFGAAAGYLGLVYRTVRAASEPERVVGRAAAAMRDEINGGSSQWAERLKAAAPTVVGGLEGDLKALKDDLPRERERAVRLLEEKMPWITDQLGAWLVQVRADLPARRKELAARLKDEAPEVMAGLKPRLARMKALTPQQAEWLKTTLTANAPAIADLVRDEMVNRALPSIEERLVARAVAPAPEQAQQEAARLAAAVDGVVAGNAEAIRTLEGDQLKERLQRAFEEALPGAVDQCASAAEARVASVRDSLKALIERVEAGGELARDDELKLRYIQLWKTYWQAKALGKDQ